MTRDLLLKNILICLIIIVSFLWFYILRIWSFIFIPVIISFFLLVLFSWVYHFSLKFLKNKYLSIFATFWIFILFFIVVWFIITTQVWSFLDNSEKFKEWFWNIINFAEKISSNLWIDLKQYLNLEYLKWFLSKLNFSAVWKNIYQTLTNMASFIWTTFIFLIFIFLERKNFKQKAKYLFDIKWFNKVQNIYWRIHTDLNVYFAAKFFLALFNWVVATIIMSLFWLDFALTFWLLVFIFDFIPAVWWIIALWLPFIYSLVTFDNVWMSFFLLLALNIPQFITWNFIEPKVMWDRLNLSSFVLIVALLFWYQFWWIIWAFLSTPIMATINIILSKFESTKFISTLLSKNWK